MAAAVVEAGADRDGAVERAAVGRAAGRQRELGRARDCLASRDDVAHVTALADARIVLVVLPDAVVAVEPDTFEAGVHDEVDDARDRVRTVHRRCAAGQDFGAPDQRRRNDVKVGGLVRAVRVARHEAAAVDENQRALRAEVAKVDFGGTRRAVRNARRLRGADGRQLVEDVFDRGSSRTASRPGRKRP